MIDYPDTAWTKPQLFDKLGKITHLLASRVFTPSTPFTRQSQTRWFELIRAVSDLVRQAALAGQRIDFTEEVSTQGEARDITSLLDRMRHSAFLVCSTTPAQSGLMLLSPTLNYVAGIGTGQFANGLFFTCPHPNELAFFMGQDRIYFYRHLMRAYLEAGCYLIARPDAG